MRILVVTTISDTVNAFLAPHLKALREAGHEIDLACAVVQPLSAEVLKHTGKIVDVGFGRSPITFGNFIALNRLQTVLKHENYDVVHAHTPIAGALARVAAARSANTVRIYSAHGFHFYRHAPVIAWLLYFPVEFFCAYFTDYLITINDEDFNRAKRLFKHPTVLRAPGVGFQAPLPSIESREAGAPGIRLLSTDILLLSVGELNVNKSHDLIIRSMPLLPENFYYVIVGEGPRRKYLRDLANDLGVTDRVHMVGFRRDVPEFLRRTDVFLHPSIREGLPVAVMEAMSLNIPVVARRIRGVSELVTEDSGVLLLEHKPRCWASVIATVARHPARYRGGAKVIRRFTIEHAVEATKAMYATITARNAK